MSFAGGRVQLALEIFCVAIIVGSTAAQARAIAQQHAGAPRVPRNRRERRFPRSAAFGWKPPQGHRC